MAVEEVYARQLYKLKRGYPIWEADPSWGVESGKRQSAVEVGDVGFMFRGEFVRLFNIHLNIGDKRQPGKMPEYFEPLHIDRERDIRSAELKMQVFNTMTVRSANVQLEGTV